MCITPKISTLFSTAALAFPPEPMNRRLAKTFVGLFALALVVGGCSSTKESDQGTASTEPPSSTSTVAPTGVPPTLALSPVFKVNQPVAMVQRDNADDFYVAERSGRVLVFRNGSTTGETVIDLSAETTTDSERGLLGLAFKPNTALFYVNYTDKSGNTHIDEYRLNDAGLGDPASRRNLMTIAQPAANHNGGQLAFGPEKKYLYIGLGDGGGSGDPSNNGQNLSVPLGKILRIDTSATTSTSGAQLPYTVPFDNPFVKRPGAMGEVFYYGLRNPWRFSFDSQTGAIWIADVGQNQQEEIDRLDKDPAGGKNFGWSLREGLLPFKGDARPSDLVEPVYVYGRAGGNCSVTGGYVYRGSTIGEMNSRYIFGDYCSGKIWALTLRDRKWTSDELSIKVPNLIGFAQDNNGEVYTLSQDGQISRIIAG